MNDRLQSFLAFISGAAVASVVTWKLLEKKYKRIADDEIESVREVYNRKLQQKTEVQKDRSFDKPEAEPSDQEMLDVIIGDLGYASPEHNGKEGKTDMAKDSKIYVIAPESFGETDFETESLTYYADKVLVYNGTDKIVKNVDDVVGHGSLNTFGEYEDDSVFVRNEHMKTDFEILLDTRNYSDVVSRKPHLVDDDDDQ